MKILLGYSYYKNQVDVREWVNQWLSRLRKGGVEVEPFCLTLDAPGPRLSWRELDGMWKNGNETLFTLYSDLITKCQDFDVFINWNGINLHPEFVKILPITKIFSCYDDPESSEDLSKPVANAYDLCLVGNIAEVETYRSWGINNVEFWPLGFFDGECDRSITKEQIYSVERDVDVTIVCERASEWRQERLDKFSNAFPQGKYFGRGWPNGFLDEEEKLPLYRKTKIGLNIHNSTGPINFRTYMLPANGVMLLCDNKSFLGKLYKLGEEAIGFDTIEEAIELCEYYLKNNEERQKIAAAGRERALKDYNELSVFKSGLEHIKKLKVCKLGIKESLRQLNIFRSKARIKYWAITAWVNMLRKIYRKCFCR